MSILYVGIDFAKNVFALRGVDESGKPALVRPSLEHRRPELSHLAHDEMCARNQRIHRFAVAVPGAASGQLPNAEELLLS